MSERPEETAIIIGAGPAGLTAAYELLEKTNIKPVILESTCDIGGISKTVRYKGNRIDIGGHRFFSKNDWVMNWWADVLPTMGAPAYDDIQLGRAVPLSEQADAPDPESVDRVMLLRQRLSRIFFLRSFFDYPISLNLETVRNLGFVRIVRIGFSYLWRSIFPIKPEKSLEDFFINRFGTELYKTFFKDYTEKVWGVPCSQIKPEWGAQRIKGLSVLKALHHAAKTLLVRDRSISQKDTETSLIGQFLYPKFGPGQLWEAVAESVQQRGGEICLNAKVVGIKTSGDRVTGVEYVSVDTGEKRFLTADHVFSTMPVRDLIEAFDPEPPADVVSVANGLEYRDFITVGLLVRKLRVANETGIKTINNILPDNWIYIQERDVKIGRLQIFNNWSPYLVADRDTVWLGLEYFCNDGDDLWNKSDAEISAFAISEMAKIDMLDPAEVLDSVVIRVPKAYPAYFGSYDNFDTVRGYVDEFVNLTLIGRNGMHRYNNMDHSMLSAKMAVQYAAGKINDKASIWDINAEEEYHEEKNR